MNCKPGDLAVFVGGDRWANPHDIGGFVEVLHANEPDIDGSHFWAIKTPDGIFEAADRHLRPIRGNSGTDEATTLEAKPATINQPKETA